jgi:tight adherence protein B
MVGALVPLLIFAGAGISAAMIFYAYSGTLHRKAAERAGTFAKSLDASGLRAKSDELLITSITIGAALWIAALLILRPSIVLGLLLLPAAALAAAGITILVSRMRVKARTEAFLNQFETVLRLMSSGLRSGLGLQQTLNLVIDETPDPARYEFSRVLGQATIGMSVHDALDDLAGRVKTSETLMMARVVRVNAQTGGDLSHVLDQLAGTIKERRRMRRKVQSLTAEGRAGAAVLAALPIFLGGFIIMTQPDMSHGLLYTPVGHIVFLIIIVLEVLGIFSLNRILQVNI